LAGSTSLQIGATSLARQLFDLSEQSLARDDSQVVGVSTVLVGAGEMERATRLLQAAAVPGLDEAYAARYLLASSQARQGQYGAAERTAQALLEEYPDSARLHHLHGSVLQAAGNVDGARAAYAAALARDADHVPSLFNLGVLETRADNADRAESLLNRAIQIEPNNEDVLLALARLAALRGDRREARSWIERLPESASSFVLLGQLAVVDGNFNAAEAAFSRAYAMSPNRDAAMELFRIRTQVGATNAAAPLESWLAITPDDTDTRFVLGSSAVQRGDIDAARTQFERIIETDAQHAPALNNLAYIYNGLGLEQQALDTAIRAYKAAPSNPAIADTVGWLYLRHGDSAAGRRFLEQAITGMPDNSEVRYHWAVVLAEDGERDRAVELLEDLLAGDDEFPWRTEAEERLAALR
jgi:Flp pilus assembly protein TadD